MSPQQHTDINKGGESMTKALKRSLWIEVDLDRLAHNFQAMKQTVGDVKIMPAVKANAYGHGIVECCRTLESCGADYLGVGSIEEGILLRENGVKMPVLIFASNLIPENATYYDKYDLIPTVFRLEQAEAISHAVSRPRKVFVKIDTGRGRLGVNAEEFPAFFMQLRQLPNIQVEGVYSHMCATDWPDEAHPEASEYPMWQYQRFTEAIRGIGDYAKEIPFLQLANTPACIAYPGIRLTGVCPGRAMWGFSPLEKRDGHPELLPPMTALKSRIIHINEVIGGKFGPNGAAKKLDIPRRIGIVAGGVSDGISPRHAKGGYVLVRGKRVPISSAICLEHMILDLTDCPEAEVGDEVVIFGKQGEEEITVPQLLNAWGKTLVEFWTSFTPHISRVYFLNGKVYSITRGDTPERITI